MAEDRLHDLAGQLAAGNGQPIGAVLVGADPRGDGAGELTKAARDDGDPRPARPHGPRERAGAGAERDAVPQHLGDHALRQSGKQRDALAQSRLEGDLAAHRPLGDRRHAVADAGIGRQFVDAFLADQGRIHVGDQKAFGAMLGRLDDDVDRLAGERLLEDQTDRRSLPVEHKIGRHALVEPAPAVEPRDALRGARNSCIAEPHCRGIGDQRGDDGGRRHEDSRR